MSYNVSIDANFVHVCTHATGKYLLADCPVCFGSGFYFDLVLNQSGSPVQLSGDLKVAQGLIHLLRTDLGTFSDYGYSDYGTQLSRFIGAKNLDDNRTRFQVLRDLMYYTSVKNAQQAAYQNITYDETIQQVVGVDVVSTEDTQSVVLSICVGDSNQPKNLLVDQFIG